VRQWIRGDALKSGSGRLRCTAGVLSPRLLLKLDGIITTIEGIGSITPITGERFGKWVEIWKKCVMLEKGFWDMTISLS
jgi:hypothetical protein